MPDRYLFYVLLSYNFAIKNRRIPGPLQRIVSRLFELILLFEEVE